MELLGHLLQIDSSLSASNNGGRLGSDAWLYFGAI